MKRRLKNWIGLGLVLSILMTSGARPCFAANWDPNRLDFSRQDHQLHFAVSDGLTLSGSVAGKKVGLFAAPVVTALTVMFAGWMKESLFDRERSLGDMKANTAGALTGMTFSFAI